MAKNQYSIIPEKGKYTAVPKGYDTSYKTMDSPDMSNYERWGSASDVLEGLYSAFAKPVGGMGDVLVNQLLPDLGIDLSSPEDLATSLILSRVPGGKIVKRGRKGATKKVQNLEKKIDNQAKQLKEQAEEISKLKTKMKPYKKKADKFNAQIEKRENKIRSNNREILK